MIERFRAWHYKAGMLGRTGLQRLPKHILFYRDGVSESQYGMVRFEEMPQIKQACQQTLAHLKEVKNSGIKQSDTWNPHLTLVVVTKRHHARFYKTNDADTNPDCGMVVDQTVVTPRDFTFYLQSHNSPLGTARNAHYVVLHDDAGWDPIALQVLVCS